MIVVRLRILRVLVYFKLRWLCFQTFLTYTLNWHYLDVIVCRRNYGPGAQPCLMLFNCMVDVVQYGWHRVARMRCDYADYVLSFANSIAAVEAVVCTVLPQWVLGWMFLFNHYLWWTTMLLNVCYRVRGTSVLRPFLNYVHVLLEQLLRLLSFEGAFWVLKSISVALNHLTISLRHQNFVLSSWCWNIVNWRAIKDRRVVNEDILLLHAIYINSPRTLLLHRKSEFWT